MTLIVVPTLGARPRELRLTLDTLRNQGVPGLQIVVVAPGNALASLGNWLPEGVESLGFDRPGLSAAINYGWSTFGDSHHYLAWLADDDGLAPGSLTVTEAALDEHPAAVAAFGRCRVVWADGRTQYVSRPGQFAMWWAHYGADRVPQQGSLFRRSAVEQVGLLDETLKYGMDLDLLLKLFTVGNVLYVPREVGFYRQHLSAISFNKEDFGAEAAAIRARHRRPPTGIANATVRCVDRAYGVALRHLPSPPPPANYTGVEEGSRSLLQSLKPLRGSGALRL